MCGIAGWFSSAPLSSEAMPRLQQMTDALAHRGPDGYGYWKNDHCALGHRRLSIIDLDNGQQPMQSHDQALTVTYNGEIYNYQDIRKKLDNYPFQTDSDTEVILALYKECGVQGFSRLRGMFAFALWDDAKKTGYLVRDPLGIKPLFVQQQGNEIRFASEAKALITNGGAQLDVSALHLLMNFRYLPGDKTLFKGIYQLPPGSLLCFRDGRTSTHKASWETRSNRYNILESLDDSVRYHLTSDVPIGAYLSGGIDSAAITKLTIKNGHTPTTFTLNVGDDPLEAENAKLTANDLQLENIQRDFDLNIDQTLKQIIWNLEIPKVNALQVASIAKLASEHVKVVLSGLGGDELFYGYNVHQLFYRVAQASKLPLASRKWLSRLGNAVLPQESIWSEPQRALMMLEHAGNWPKVYGLLRNVWDTPSLRMKIYSQRVLDENLPNAYDVIEDHWPTNIDPIKAMGVFEVENKLVNDLLWQEDRTSMAYGLEVRTPFVDKEMLSCVNHIGWQKLMPHGKKKWALKHSLAEILPSQTLTRPKSGFQVNAGEFYQHHLQRLSEHYLSQDMLQKHQLFSPSFVREVQNLPANKGHRWHYFMLYLILGTHIWLEQFEQAS